MKEFALMCAILSLVFACVTAFSYCKGKDKVTMAAGFLSFVLGLTGVIVSAVTLIQMV